MAQILEYNYRLSDIKYQLDSTNNHCQCAKNETYLLYA